MMLPYNSTLDDVPSEQVWNKGWMCTGDNHHPLPLFKAEKKDDDKLPDDRQAWHTHKSTITTQEACYDACTALFKL